MAAASAVVFDLAHPEAIVEHLREAGSERRQLLARIQQLEVENRVLAQRNRELERELVLTRLDSGELTPPNAIVDATTAEIWLAWARAHNHTDACSCHRCAAARRVL